MIEKRVNPKLLNNYGEFSEPFFRKIPVRADAAVVDFGGGLTKSYAFPTLYGDVVCVTLGFDVPLAEAGRALTGLPLKPVRSARGGGVLIVAAYRYGKVHQMEPYNEIVIGLAVQRARGLDLPLAPLLFDWPHAGLFVLDMPVTSEENMVRGRRLWGLPKRTMDIEADFSTRAGAVVCADPSGKSAYTVACEAIGAPKRLASRSKLVSRLGSALLFSPAKSSALAAPGATKRDRASDFFACGAAAAPAVQALAGALTRPPFLARYSREMSSSFDLPLGPSR